MNDRQAQALIPGAQLDCYRIESTLGTGAFGITYAAEDLELGRRVAMKEYFPVGLAYRSTDGSTLAPSSETHAELYRYGRAQFVNEARVLAQFSEPNIVPIHRFLEANDTAYLVMNYEDGRTLDRVLRRYGRLQERQMLAVATHMLRGLSALHAKGILHGDIKPANILVRRSGAPLLIDFGAARLAVGRKRGNIKSVMTPVFAALELFGQEGREGSWTDIYALGATLFQCATGRPPQLVTDRVDALQSGRPDPVVESLGQCSDALNRELIDCLDWMLKPSAGARPQSAGEVLECITEIWTATRSRGSRAAPAVPAAPRPVPIDAALKSAAEDSLTDAVGPIAATLVERAAQVAESGAQFVAELSAKIPDSGQRAGFLAACEPYYSHGAAEARTLH